MSAVGTKRTSQSHWRMSAFEGLADLSQVPCDAARPSIVAAPFSSGLAPPPQVLADAAPRLLGAWG